MAPEIRHAALYQFSTEDLYVTNKVRNARHILHAFDLATSARMTCGRASHMQQERTRQKNIRGFPYESWHWKENYLNKFIQQNHNIITSDFFFPSILLFSHRLFLIQSLKRVGIKQLHNNFKV